MSNIIKLDFSGVGKIEKPQHAYKIDPQEICRRDKGRALKLVLKECRERDLLKDIFDRYDRLVVASSNLAFLLTEFFPDEREGSLVMSTLDRAAAACGQAENTGRNPDAKEREFLMTLLESAYFLNKWKLIGIRSNAIIDKGEAWPGIDMPITAWLKKNLFDSIEFTPNDHAESSLNLRVVLAHKLLQIPDLEFLAPELSKESLLAMHQ